MSQLLRAFRARDAQAFFLVAGLLLAGILALGLGFVAGDGALSDERLTLLVYRAPTRRACYYVASLSVMEPPRWVGATWDWGTDPDLPLGVEAVRQSHFMRLSVRVVMDIPGGRICR